MTPIKCFRVKGLEIYTEDWAGGIELVCTAANGDMFTWMCAFFSAYHKVPIEAMES